MHLRRSGKDICHENIVATQRPNPGYMLNAVTAPVLYKLIHYFMENPIRDETVLMYPIEEVEVSSSRRRIAHCVRTYLHMYACVVCLFLSTSVAVYVCV